MRTHRIAFPDPIHRPGHAGLTLVFPSDTQSAAYRAAYTTCGHYIQPIVDAKQAGQRDRLTAQRLHALTAYSRCMRSHQVPLLDPDPNDGHITMGTVPGIADLPGGRRDPLFRQADSACRHLLPAGVRDDGTGPS
jgi:hypothetical protein